MSRGCGRDSVEASPGFSYDRHVLRRVVFVLFVASGFSSLLYQVVWLRLAVAAFGIVTPVLSIVLSTDLAACRKFAKQPSVSTSRRSWKRLMAM